MKKQDILGHWVLALAPLLLVAVLSIPQIDKYIVGHDAHYSLISSGWIAETAFSPVDVLNKIATTDPNQGPLYYLLLNQWGNLVGNELALARVFTVFAGLLSFAMIYRLTRDAVSPVAANFAMIILASNAFYAFYIPHARYYPHLVFLSALVLWLYLRIAVLERASRPSDYVALAFACAALVSTHAYGLLLYVFCSLYHLLFVRKDRRWLLAPISAIAGLALAGPLIFVLFTSGVERAVAGHGPRADDLWTNFAAWFNVNFNGSPLLVLLAVAGVAAGWRRKCLALRRAVILFALLLLSIALTAEITRTLDAGLMRHLLASLPIAVLFQAAGLCALYRERRILGALLCLWIIAGLIFASTADWKLYIQGRIRSYKLPPWHLISRTARQSDDPAHVIAYMLPDTQMYPNRYSIYSLSDHWFLSRDIEFRMVGAAKWLEEYLRLYRGARISPWLAYQTSSIDNADVAALEETMDALGYRACQRVSLPVWTETVQYGWVSLDCQPAEVIVSNQVDPLRYEFYGAELSEDGSRLFIASSWNAQNAAALDRLRISYQLLSSDWRNAAQLDSQLKQEGELSQAAIDVSEVPPGQYRLMLILYDAITGDRFVWEGNPGDVPEMLELDSITIPVS